MTTQYRYRLVPETSVPASTRATAKEAFDLACWYWDLETKPGMAWISLSSGPGAVKETQVPIAGFCRTGKRADGSWDWDIYIVVDQSLREIWLSVGHEVAHIYCIESGLGTMITRSRRATEEEETKAQETFAEKFSQRFTRTYFDGQRTIAGKR